MGRGNNVNIHWSWKKLIPAFMDDFEEFTTSVEEITAVARELELEVEPEDVIELLWPQDKTFPDEEFLPAHGQSGSLTWNLFLVKTLCRLLNDKGLQISHKLSLQSCGRVWMECFQFWKKFYCRQNVAKQHCMLQRNRSWKEESTNEKIHYCLILRNCHSQLSLYHPPLWSVSSHQHQGKTLRQQKDCDSLKA